VRLQLEGKSALVTGGSRGIGRAIVLALAESGARVAACYRQDSDDVASLRKELERRSNGSYTIRVDVADADSVSELVGDVRERFGQVDVLVNNAGIVSHATLAQLELEEWQRVLEVNLTGVYLVTRGVMDLMPEGASVINVTSAVAMRGMVGRTHYTASKAGIIGFTRSLCKELGPRGIRVNAIAPGIIETDQVAGLTDEQRARYGGLAALGRLGQPDEIAGAALFLATDLSSFVSGVTMNVDGGI
jgi:3-oxoacyl-[acyl-carrier protein] reductase